jgi:hypothetical protein
LALEAYRLEHGNLPESLAELGNTFLDPIPIDPYSGRDFVYFPHGLPQPSTPLAEHELQQAQKAQSAIEPSTPGIWCLGPKLMVVLTGPQRPADYGSQLPKDSPRDESYEYYRTLESQQTLRDYPAWALGYWFTIPEQLK